MEEEITTTSPLDAPPADSLEDIFTLPEALQSDERIVRWYDEMVSRLRREAQGVPMKTLQYTLMERIAFFYVSMRHQEFSDQSMSVRERQQGIAAWQGMIDQFNRLLEKHNDKVVNEMLLKVQDILKEVIPIVSDPTERASLRRRLQEEFANIDM